MGVLILCLIAALCSVGHTHTTHFSRNCPDLAPYQPLSLDRVAGLWHVIYKLDTSNRCLRWNFTLREDEESFSLTETRQFSALDSLGVNHTHKLTSVVDIPNPEVPARMRVRWPTSLTGKADFIVFAVGGDYEYLAIFECDRAGLVHRRSVSLLSRTRTMDQAFVSNVKGMLADADVSYDHLNNIDQSDCGNRRYNWHTNGELFGLLSHAPPKNLEQRLGTGLEDYDISELEILGDGVRAEGFPAGSISSRPKKFV